ncbi:ankyrin repeat domain-containing protein [Luteolibacter marinus]|uniref:ankyrin repeat domain-containing protein n=1 Tax=Luteolibacter marinus TaxID=2776705 RepID=UPI001867024F|nr:ankyrin repeat domain-containing protein [Luteolibacter marinus]
MKVAPEIDELLDQAEEGYMIPCRSEKGRVDLHARAVNGDTLLHVAVGARNFTAIRLLLDAGIDINSQGDYHETPLFAAAASCDLGLVGFLLQLGADPKIPDHRGTLPVDALLYRLKGLPEEELQRLSNLPWTIFTGRKEAEQADDSDSPQLPS